MSGIRFVSTGELEGITARQGNHLCDYPQGMPICTQNAGGLTFFRRTVFRKRRTEALFEAQYLHFIFGPNQNTPCSQGVFWFGHCTNWGIGRPARLLSIAALDASIVPTGELEGRQDVRGFYHGLNALYQLGNWKAGKTRQASSTSKKRLYQLGNWKAGKTLTMFSRMPMNCTNWGIGRPARHQTMGL